MGFIQKIFSGGTEGVLKGVSDIVGKFVADPNQKLQLSEEIQKSIIEQQNKLIEQAEQEQANVNATMQAESKSEHWAQWLWRPMVGFTFCAILINNYILVGYFTWAKAVPIPGEVWSAMLVILGATAAGRSLEKWQDLKNQAS